MKWIVVLLFTTTQMFTQSLIDLTDCYVEDFKKVKGDIIIASPMDTIKSFERFTVIRVVDSLVTYSSGDKLTHQYMFLKELTGKQFSLRSDHIRYDETYDAQLLEKKLSKGKYKFYYVGEKDKIAGLQRWGLYDLINLMYDYAEYSPCYVLKSGNKKYFVDKYAFKEANFVSQTDYNRLVNKYGYTFGRDIMERVVRIGMTPDMVYEAWGSPNDTSEYISVYGSQLTYRYNYSTVTFMNGKVYSIYQP